MGEIVVGIADLKVSNNPKDVLITYSLGSCICIAVYDPMVKVAGGAQILEDTNYFRIGQKNITAMRKIFWRNNVLLDGAHTGEHFNRTMQMDISNGRCILKCSDGAVRYL